MHGIEVAADLRIRLAITSASGVGRSPARGVRSVRKPARRDRRLVALAATHRVPCLVAWSALFGAA